MLMPSLSENDKSRVEFKPTVPRDEQLGLRLESRRGPREVPVIDSVQEPTENWKETGMERPV